MEFIKRFWIRITFWDHLIGKTIGKHGSTPLSTPNFFLWYSAYIWAKNCTGLISLAICSRYAPFDGLVDWTTYWWNHIHKILNNIITYRGKTKNRSNDASWAKLPNDRTPASSKRAFCGSWFLRGSLPECGHLTVAVTLAQWVTCYCDCRQYYTSRRGPHGVVEPQILL